MGKKILISVILILVAFAAYLKYAVSKFEYTFNLKSYTAKSINITGTSTVQIVLDIAIKSALFFSIPVNSLYYEIYYKNNLLGKSANITAFTLVPGEFVNITEPVDIFINNENAQVAINYISKIPTDFTAKIKVTVFGIGIKLTELRFTY
jgi:LEA14-like dessication related protein